ncbi:adenosine A2a receptor a [Paramormyrops kingsleyae]|uniref:Adenosine receptor A2 n=1 Tax=Paramormyrops kingsleyae TaxID=1676925 RepID=A0A3B3RVV4_9TELE|nr:adenosine receptor A2a-like [Paramormyrops kingsleyae]XP_023689546.1 adenosine receptor A2a-like [Paramormyrops kingsleyae]XP_023689547.1 adenosine receptor A2a-like [Paramormyrops kingsleyae]
MLYNAPAIVYIVLELLIAVLSVLGNVLVCWAVCLNSNLQTITNFFVVSLAAADIAVGVLAVPFAIAISTGFCAHFYGCLFIACFVLVLTQSSIFSLLAIAIDRYIAIKIPLRYNSLVTSQRAKGIIAICWVLSVVIGLTPMLGWHTKNRPQNDTKLTNSTSGPKCPSGTIECLFEKVVTMDYMVYFNFFGCVLMPLLLMLGIYLRIFMAARRQLKRMELKVVHGERSRSTLQKEVHAAKSLAIIVGLFAICWLPLHVINCFTLFCPECARPHASIMYLAIILSHANSVVNPFIYAYRIREFRHTFRRIIRRHVLGRRDHFESGSCSATRPGSTRATTLAAPPESCPAKTNGFTLDGYSDRGSFGNNLDSCNGHEGAKTTVVASAVLPPSDHVPHSPPVDITLPLHLQSGAYSSGLPTQNGDERHSPGGAEAELKAGREFSAAPIRPGFCRHTARCPELTQVS